MYIEFAHLKVVVGAISLTLRTFYCWKKDKVTASEEPWLCTKKSKPSRITSGTFSHNLKRTKEKPWRSDESHKEAFKCFSDDGNLNKCNMSQIARDKGDTSTRQNWGENKEKSAEVFVLQKTKGLVKGWYKAFTKCPAASWPSHSWWSASSPSPSPSSSSPSLCARLGHLVLTQREKPGQ